MPFMPHNWSDYAQFCKNFDDFLQSLKHICDFIFIILMINFGNILLLFYTILLGSSLPCTWSKQARERERERERERPYWIIMIKDKFYLLYDQMLMMGIKLKAALPGEVVIRK